MNEAEDAIYRVSEKYDLGWSVEAALWIMGAFIKDKCSMEKFIEYVERYSQMELASSRNFKDYHELSGEGEDGEFSD